MRGDNTLLSLNDDMQAAATCSVDVHASSVTLNILRPLRARSYSATVQFPSFKRRSPCRVARILPSGASYHTLLQPKLARAVLQRLGQVVRADGVRAGQVGDGPGQLEQAVKGARRKVHLGHG